MSRAVKFGRVIHFRACPKFSFCRIEPTAFGMHGQIPGPRQDLLVDLAHPASADRCEDLVRSQASPSRERHNLKNSISVGIAAQQWGTERDVRPCVYRLV